ncbi:MAG TPA: MFS transporter, partial [Solirubrobacteraceae bacterium]|nr:MFS transporter [Solirubrobacteraceae bacterium]
RFSAGMTFARRNRTVRLLLIGQAVALVLFTLVIPIEVIYAKESLGTSDAGFGILIASWGAGIVVGSLVYLLIRQRSALGLIVFSTALIGIAYLGLATAETLLVACLISVVGGAGNGVQWIAVVTSLQEMTPADYQARIVGLLESLGAAMPGVGYLIGGGLVALGSPRTAYVVAGTGVLVLVLCWLLLRPNLEPATPHQRRVGDLPLPESLAATPTLEPARREAR